MILCFFKLVMHFGFFFLFCFEVIFKILFIYLWLHWVFVAARGLSLVVVSGAILCLWCPGFTVVASLLAEHRL